MELKYNVTGAERKALVTALSEITNATPKYKGAPSFAYEVDRYTVDKNGKVFCDADCDVENLLAALAEKGFDAENASAKNTLAINMPRSGFNEATLENLRRLVASKSTLIQHAIGAESLPIEVTAETVRFPWFALSDDATANKAYTHFIAALGNMARTQQRITATEKTVDNEKYAFRCFLLAWLHRCRLQGRAQNPACQIKR
ncbi:MAG: virulence protein [Ruthenibacterium sp.]